MKVGVCTHAVHERAQTPRSSLRQSTQLVVRKNSRIVPVVGQKSNVGVPVQLRRKGANGKTIVDGDGRTSETHTRGFLPKSGIPGHFSAEISYSLETSTKHTPGALLLAKLTL